MANTYVTEFTRENVRELTRDIQLHLRAFTEKKGKPLDLFVIAAALQQAAYEIVMTSLCENKEEASKKIDEMKPIAEDIVKLVDTYRKENKSLPTEELLGTIFASNLLTEFYAHNRDLKLQALAESNGLEYELTEAQGQDEAVVVESNPSSDSSSSASE